MNLSRIPVQWTHTQWHNVEGFQLTDVFIQIQLLKVNTKFQPDSQTLDYVQVISNAW